MHRRTFLLAMVSSIPAAFVVGCGPSTTSGVRVVDADAARDLVDDPPADLVVLDIRTPEEFAEGHLADAELLDFYRQDFSARVAELDRDTPYLVYCRSGNRSGQARELMIELGFTDVADLGGGILAWSGAGHPVIN